MKEEQWKVFRQDNEYCISSHGRFIRRDTGVCLNIVKNYTRKGNLTSSSVGIRTNGKRYSYTIPILVLSYFKEPSPYKGCITFHINGDPMDNTIDNLIWKGVLK